MNGTWLRRVRTLHTWLGVFFTPMLLLFIVTGWWQTFATDDTKDHGYFNGLLAKFSTIHTDSYFSHAGGHQHASAHFKILVACMSVTLILTILLGLALAFNARKAWRTALALVLGIAVPLVVLYFN